MQHLINANLPYRFEFWRGPAFTQVFDRDDTWIDIKIWNHAREMDCVIVSKDADCSDRIILAEPPPRVIHIRVGNMKMREFHDFIARTWAHAVMLIEPTNWSSSTSTESTASHRTSPPCPGVLHFVLEHAHSPPGSAPRDPRKFPAANPVISRGRSAPNPA